MVRTESSRSLDRRMSSWRATWSTGSASTRDQERDLAIARRGGAVRGARRVGCAELPDRLTIVVIPGNHDAVCPAEPQPALPANLTTYPRARTCGSVSQSFDLRARGGRHLGVPRSELRRPHPRDPGRLLLAAHRGDEADAPDAAPRPDLRGPHPARSVRPGRARPRPRPGHPRHRATPTRTASTGTGASCCSTPRPGRPRRSTSGCATSRRCRRGPPWSTSRASASRPSTSPRATARVGGRRVSPYPMEPIRRGRPGAAGARHVPVPTTPRSRAVDGRGGAAARRVRQHPAGRVALPGGRGRVEAALGGARRVQDGPEAGRRAVRVPQVRATRTPSPRSSRSTSRGSIARYLRYLSLTIDPDAPPPPLGRTGSTRREAPRARAARVPGRTRAPRRRRSR